MADLYQGEGQVLEAAKRSGWRRIGQRPLEVDQAETDKKTGNIVHTKVPDPEGRVIWSIVGPDGDPDEIVVKPHGGTPEGGGVAYEIVEGPKRAIPAEKTPTDWRSQGKWIDQPDGGKRWQAFNPETGRTEDVPGGPAPIPAPTDRSSPGTVQWQPRQLTTGTDAGKWVEDPLIWDPATNSYRPAPGLTPRPTKNPFGEPSEPKAPTTATINKQTMQWDPARGTWITPPGTPAVPVPNMGDTTPGVREGYLVQLKWDGEKWDIDPAVKPSPWSAAAQQAAEKAASAPKEGDTRPNIEGGYNVEQTYSGGEWTTTKIGSRAQPLTPASLTTPTEQPYIARTDETGQVVWTPNQNYLPKAPASRGELAQRVANLQQQATAMRDKIAADTTIPADQKGERFKQWYAQNIAPQTPALDAQQQDLARTEALELQEKQRAAYATAQTAGTQAIQAYQAQAPRTLGPGAREMLNQSLNAINRAGGRPEIDYSALVTQEPNLQGTVQQQVNEALKTISPTAAAATGAPMPNYAGINIGEALGAAQWAFPGGAGPAPAGAAPGATDIPPWARADQSQGMAPAGNAMGPPGVAGTVLPGSPQYLGGPLPSPISPPPSPQTWTQSMPNFGNPQLPSYPYVFPT